MIHFKTVSADASGLAALRKPGQQNRNNSVLNQAVGVLATCAILTHKFRLIF
ncbi:MAG: hypothetical protein PHP23_01050 [Desulfobacterales bacterium]|nr:hypothetical protein [Desulfobacterales bacterium]MDD4070996.1 hypothetical protein [Desulfobacterales bacterium]MDD4391909.1 hypothetical protein [Desulfobacterales bacterium]